MMIRNVFVNAERTSLPLTRIALCLDCEQCFELGRAGCPACGSETWAPVARFLEKSPRDLDLFGLPTQLG